MKQRAYNAKPERNEAIFALRRLGWTLTKIARAFDLTPTRVWGILHTLDWADKRTAA